MPRLRIEVQHPRLTADDLHPVHEGVPLAEEELAVTRHVDHAVVGRHEGARFGRQSGSERTSRSIHRLQGVRPLIRLPAALMGDAIQLRCVEIDEGSGMLGHEVGRNLRAVGRIGGGDEVRSAHDRLGEAGPVELRARHHEARASRGGFALEDRLCPLPRERIEPVGLPALELIRSLIRAGDPHSIAHQPVLARIDPCQQGRQRGGGRRGEDRAGHILLATGFGEEPGVPGAGGEVARAESVDDEEDRTRDGREPLPSSLERGEDLGNDTGEAPGAGRVRR